MNLQKRLPVICIALFCGSLFAQEIHAQGLLRRLRNRVAPVIQDQLNQSLPSRASALDSNRPAVNSPSTPLPNNPPAGYRVPRTPQQDRASQQYGTTPQYGASPRTVPAPRLPSGIAPANRIPPLSGGVAQTSGTAPLSSATEPPTKPIDLSRLGGSILQREDGNGDTATTNQGGFAGATIGIRAVEANPGYPGIQVVSFKEHSQADDAGLKVGDYIFGINGESTASLKAVTTILAKQRPGDTVTLRIGRGGQVSDLEITLVQSPTGVSAKPPLPPQPSLAVGTPQTGGKMGADVRDIPGSRGVQVTQIMPNSPAAVAGIQLDDRIISINGKMISNSDALANTLITLRPGENVALQLVRNNTLVQSNVRLANQVEIDAAARSATERLSPGDAPDATMAPQDASDTALSTAPVATPKSETAASGSSETKDSGGLLGGVGSVLGGLFGGSKNTAKPTPSPASDPLALPVDQIASPESVEALPTPEATPLPAPEPESKTDKKSKEDSSDDVEAIRAEVRRLQEKLKKLESGS